MNPLIAILFIITILCLSCNTPSTGESGMDKPNIVWIVAEDLSPYVAAFGDSTVATPNLDRLAAEGVRYTNCYSVSGVCAPSRFTLATGVYTTSAGAQHMRTQWHTDFMARLGLTVYEVVPPPQVRMMSEILRRDGYYCTNNDKTDYQFVAPVTAWDESSPYAHWRNRNFGQPFFSVFNLDITHESQVFAPTAKKNLRYREDFPQDPATNPVPPGGALIDSAEWTLNVTEDLPLNVPPYLADTPETRKDIRRVYSNIIEMDRQVGLLLDQLEADGLLENTIIMWYSDHGGPLPRQKRLLYDSGIRVPMIIRYPGKWNAGQLDDQLISFVDFAPTVFSLAGIELPGYLEGQAFAGEFKSSPRRYVHAAADRIDTEYDMIRAVRDSRYKYLRNFYPEKPYYLPIEYRERMSAMAELLRLREEGKLNTPQAQWFLEEKPLEELFDCRIDPHELNNLAGDPTHSAKLSELRQECARWMTATGDKGRLPEAELLERFWPGRVQPGTFAPEFHADGETGVITCPTEGASLGYQFVEPGAVAGPSWRIYREPFAIQAGSELIMIAHRIGYAPSTVVRVPVASLPVAHSTNHPAAGTSRPNIILILTDDQGWGDLSINGNDTICTPVIDQFSREAVSFDRFYVCPVCAPTRASILTGRYHLRTGCTWVTHRKEVMRSMEITLAEVLKAGGYRTGCFGKWHNGEQYPHNPQGQGFDEFFGFSAGHWNNYFTTTLIDNDKSVQTSGYITDILTDHAIRFIEESGDQPFFCYIPYNAPHSPMQVADRYFDKYKTMGLTDFNAAAYGMIENIDDNVGRILRTLEHRGIAAETIVLFTTDNGPNGDRYNGGMKGRKAQVDEGGVRVPLYIRYPNGGLIHGSKVGELAAHIDLLPTLLDLAGIDRPAAQLDGRTLLPLLRGEESTWPERYIYAFPANRNLHPFPGSVRSNRYRLTIEADSSRHLFDMLADPGQTTSISKENPLQTKEMAEAYITLFTEMTASGNTPPPIEVGHSEAPGVNLPAPEAVLSGGLKFKEYWGWANDWIVDWATVDANASWDIDVVTPGTYQVSIQYCLKESDLGSTIRVESGGRHISAVLEDAHYPDYLPSPDRVKRSEVHERQWGTKYIGVISLKGGLQQLQVSAEHIPGSIAMELKSVLLKRL